MRDNEIQQNICSIIQSNAVIQSNYTSIQYNKNMMQLQLGLQCGVCGVVGLVNGSVYLDMLNHYITCHNKVELS